MTSTVTMSEEVNGKKTACGAIDKQLTRNQDAESHNNLGVTYHVQGRVDLAIGEYEKSLNINPGFADAHSNLGVAYYAQGNTDQAIKEFKEALRINLGLAQSHYNLGVAYKAMGNLQCAMAEFKEALRIDPNDAATNFSLGETYQNQGEHEKALEFYERYIKLAPGDDACYIRQAEEQIRQLKAKVGTRRHDINQTESLGRALDRHQSLLASASC